MRFHNFITFLPIYTFRMTITSTMVPSDFEIFCESTQIMSADVVKALECRTTIFRFISTDEKLMLRAKDTLKELKTVLRRLEKIANRFMEMTPQKEIQKTSEKSESTRKEAEKISKPNTTEKNQKAMDQIEALFTPVNSIKDISRKLKEDANIFGTPPRKRPTEDKSKQKAKKSKTNDISKPDVKSRDKSDNESEKLKSERKIEKVKKKIERQVWDISPLDPNEWEFETGEFICIHCGIDQVTCEQMKGHFGEKTCYADLGKEMKSVLQNLGEDTEEEILPESQQSNTIENTNQETNEGQQNASQGQEKSVEVKTTESNQSNKNEPVVKSGENMSEKVLEEKAIETEKPTEEKTAESALSSGEEKKSDDSNNSKEKNIENNTSHQNEKASSNEDNKIDETDSKMPEPISEGEPETTKKIQNSDKRGDEMCTEQSSLESSSQESIGTGFRCKHCEVEPFETEEQLTEHNKLKHQIKCKFCEDIFPSRGYMMTHQRSKHPAELKALQERRKSKKAAKMATEKTA